MPKKDNKIDQIAKLIKESKIEFSVDDYDEEYYSMVYNYFCTLEDSRQQIKVIHKLSDVITIVFFCVLSGIDEWAEMERFSNKHINVFKKYMELPNGIPSHDTIERVMSIIDSEVLEEYLKQILVDMMEKIIETNNINESLYENKDKEIVVNDVYAADGKENRKTGKNTSEDEKDKRNLNNLSVFSTEYQVCLFTKRIDEKTNEIPMLPKVLNKLNLSKTVVTVDALNTQKDTAKVVIDKGGDYCFTLKENHPFVYSEVSTYFTDEVINELENKKDCYYSYIENKTYETIQREHYITNDISWFNDKTLWKGLKCFGLRIITRRNKKTKEETKTYNYYLCSFKEDAQLLSISTRRHWNVENNLHYMLDIVFKEDYLHTRNKKSLQSLGIINKYVMTILKLIKEIKSLKKERSMRSIRHDFAWGFEEELEWLFKALTRLYNDGSLK